MHGAVLPVYSCIHVIHFNGTNKNYQYMTTINMYDYNWLYSYAILPWIIFVIQEAKYSNYIVD